MVTATISTRHRKPGKSAKIPPRHSSDEKHQILQNSHPVLPREALKVLTAVKDVASVVRKKEQGGAKLAVASANDL